MKRRYDGSNSYSPSLKIHEHKFDQNESLSIVETNVTQKTAILAKAINSPLPVFCRTISALSICPATTCLTRLSQHSFGSDAICDCRTIPPCDGQCSRGSRLFVFIYTATTSEMSGTQAVHHNGGYIILWSHWPRI